MVKANTTIPAKENLLTSNVARTIAKPVLDLNFTKNAPIDARINVSRASSATYTNSSGLIAYATPNQPRIDYDAATGACNGLLTEDYAVNLTTYSAQMIPSLWSYGPNSTYLGEATSPDGTLTASRVVGNGSGGNEFVAKQITYAANTIYTASIWARLESGTVPTAGAILTISYTNDGIGTQVRAVVAFNGNLTSTWKRFSVTYTNITAGSYTAFFIADQNNTAVIQCWGAQVEAGAFATSYIPTGAANASRALDAVVIQGQNFASWYNQTQGSFYIECDNTFSTAVTTYPRVIMFSDVNGNQNNCIQCIYYTASSGIQVAVWRMGSFLNATNATVTSGSLVKVSFGYDQIGISGSYNGGAIQTNTNPGLPVVDRVGIGTTPYGGGNITGHIKRFTYWPQRLSNAQLVTLTS